jgi:hypothetical protein
MHQMENEQWNLKKAIDTYSTSANVVALIEMTCPTAIWTEPGLLWKINACMLVNKKLRLGWSKECNLK